MPSLSSLSACRLWLACLTPIPLAGLAAGVMNPQPVAKLGGLCPSGYSANGAYCIPGRQARAVVEKRGLCPSGYASNGAYCLAGPQAHPALPKIGATCPSGWSANGAYCLER